MLILITMLIVLISAPAVIILLLFLTPILTGVSCLFYFLACALGNIFINTSISEYINLIFFLIGLLSLAGIIMFVIKGGSIEAILFIGRIVPYIALIWIFVSDDPEAASIRSTFITLGIMIFGLMILFARKEIGKIVVEVVVVVVIASVIESFAPPTYPPLEAKVEEVKFLCHGCS